MSLEQWKNVDTFQPNIQWQKDLALEIINTCHQILECWGETTRNHFCCEDLIEEHDKSHYEDEVIIIECFKTHVENDYNKYLKWTKRLEVILVSSRTLVLSFDHETQWHSCDTHTTSQNPSQFRIFRIGSWLNHIESLRIKAQQENLQKLQEQRKRDEQQRKRDEEDRLKNFGRID